MEKQDTGDHATGSENLMSIKVEDPSSSISTSIRKMICEVHPLSSECCIFKAPKRLQEDEITAFDPLLVSIGPFHHGKEELKSMEKLKAAYLNAFLNRCSDDINLDTCIEMVKEWEPRIRNCYAETIEFDSDDFVKMILLDSCFIIEILYRYTYVNHAEEITDHLSHPRIVLSVKIDMMLIENQLPFFVLQGLFDLAFPNSEGTYGCLSNLCILYFTSCLLITDRNLAMENITRHQQQTKIKHILDLIKCAKNPSIPRRIPTNPLEDNSLWKATELEEAGMVIKPCLNYKSAADICYKTGVLEIPKLMVNTSSDRVLRNLIVLERCLYYHESFITDYIHFMDNLIDTSNDIELLIRNGVIVSFSSDNQQVATLFNNLRPPIFTGNYFYYGIQEEVNAFCKVPRHKWRAILRRDYCSSPWIIASTIGAIILLSLTFIQTVCSVISVS